MRANRFTSRSADILVTALDFAIGASLAAIVVFAVAIAVDIVFTVK
jgi:hypothetical protein